MAGRSTNRRRQLFPAIGFLLPNILGVLTFVIFPVLFSIVLAFTNWDLRRHNPYREESLDFVGLENFVRLLTESDFVRFLGNTLFLMMGIPFAVGGALIAATLLSKNTRGGSLRVWLYLCAAGGLVISVGLLAALGLGGTGMVILLAGVASGVLILGLAGGTTAYRTLFYMPHFTAGVATYLLWKKLYNPQTGPINQALQPLLDGLAGMVNTTPALFGNLRWVWMALAGGLLAWAMGKLRRMWSDGDLGTKAAVMPVLLLWLPVVVATGWRFTSGTVVVLWAILVLSLAWQGWRIGSRGRELEPPTASEGFGSALVLALGVMVGQFVMVGFSAVSVNLPAMASDGLSAPNWLTDYHWAKPALMIMALWGAIGSNNMLLYLAALTNIPQELYEAADIDGAGRLQRFWHVTWPQLAPTTFFIAVMATIHGLQGGFEMARTMTEGGPAGATTTLSYFIYTEGFETGRLSFAAATAWVLFILVFSLTLFNWRFGNKYVND